ncbi:NUDIX domain [Teratosphaeria destructans]|uniref:NUDIX domain n=1 Tax=Teratosphaeria destructans TaxID=418781 RepID=A0A9W7SMI2_9PEZI|nr:NUDIX domain [Teratosphaeria destructans]
MTTNNEQDGTSNQTETRAFTFNPSVATFNVPKQTYLTTYPQPPNTLIATGALVLIPPKPHILLLQRSRTDTMPNLWEVPGGACDDSDPTILHGAARELFEETGLRVQHFVALVGEPQVFTTGSGKRICKFLFLVEVEDERKGGMGKVRLDEREHQAFVWASEGEVREGRVGEVLLRFTSREMEEVVLGCFRADC